MESMFRDGRPKIHSKYISIYIIYMYIPYTCTYMYMYMIICICVDVFGTRIANCGVNRTSAREGASR